MGDRIQILGGIDEAGLGPLLGPLVIGGLVMAGPKGKSPWVALQKGFCKKPRSRKDRRIRVDDSKRVNQGPHGRMELERTALSLWSAVHGRMPKTIAELVAKGVAGADLSVYPWYGDLAATPLPRFNDAATLELDIHIATKTIEKADIQVLGYPFRIVDVGTFNQLIRKHDNKGTTLFDATTPVLRACLGAIQRRAKRESTELGPATIVVDRHGGRGHYNTLLRRALPRTRIEIKDEGPSISRYLVGQHAEVVFAENGESRAFPTAAGSCLAKYLRELLIERINLWFQKRRPDLKPTAGYYADGRRFLDDLGELRQEVAQDLLVRIR